MIFYINPCSKPRQTRADKWKKRPCVMKYRSFADELRLQAAKINPVLDEINFKLGETLIVSFFIPMPKTWSKKKKAEMAGSPHQQRPDIDNLLKAFMDALAKEDSYVYKVVATKRWAYCGSITALSDLNYIKDI